MKKVFLLLITITSITINIIYGQDKITGKVTDENGKPIIKALIKVFSKNGAEIKEHKAIYSDSNGAFVLDIEGFVEKIQVEKKGFLLKEYVFDSQDKTLSIILIKIV